MHFFRPKHELHDAQRLEILLERDFLLLRGTGTDHEPALLQGNVVLELREPTTLRSVTLQFRGKAYVAQPPQQDSMSTNNPTSTYIVCKHNWSFLDGAKKNKNSFTLKAGRHLFPFKLQLGGSLPSSLVTDSMGGASVAYKLRAVATRTGLNQNIQAVAPVYLLRAPSPTALEYQQTRDIEYTWMNKLLFYIAIPHVAWAAGDELVALLKITPLVKGVGVVSITTSLRETTKLYGRQGSNMRKVAVATHEILGGKAVPVSELIDRKGKETSRLASPSNTPTTPTQPEAGPSRVNDASPEPEHGENDIVTTLSIRVPSQSTPSHSSDPVHVAYVVHWSLLVTNADGHISELFCSLPITILDSYLLTEVRRHTSLARQLLLGGTEQPAATEEKSELPSYLEHVRDRVANMALSEANTLRVTNPWVQSGISPTIVNGQEDNYQAPLEIISDSPFTHDPDHPIFLDWVNSELLISQGATKVAFPTNAEAEGSGYSTPIPPADHPPTPPMSASGECGSYLHDCHANEPTPGIFVATLEPTSSFSHPAWLSSRPDPKAPRNLAPSSAASAEAVHKRVLEISQPRPNVNSELLHKAFTEVPDYDVAVRGFLGGVPPLSSMQGLPSYQDSEASRSGETIS
ncbi:Arrestin-C domain-containing protein [Mycena chlorophos]|uniref:Arrestin-C domain-containing protein n=1 Tax=Mycena chlorophos TaxID=658473 RepID=A0A8H6VRB4_MYCCL|nr:Arrestin-C domain-containing protein [Mycena chlorophos]